MNQTLQAGGNVSINGFSGTVIISHDIDTRHDINLTAFLLTDAGKVQGDHGIVFFNQPREQNGAATFISPTQSGNTKTHRIDFDLRKIPTGINKIAVTLSEENRNSFSSVRNLKAEVHSNNDDIVQLNPSSFNAENGIIVLELYVRNNQAKVKSIWQGFTSGLDGICRNYGVDVAENNADSNIQPTNASEHSTNSSQSRGVVAKIKRIAVLIICLIIGVPLILIRMPITLILGFVIIYLGYNSYSKMKKREKREREREELERKRSELMAKYGNLEIVNKLIYKVIWEGQTKEQLIDSLGYPYDKQQKTKIREIWKYSYGNYKKAITLENGVVVRWELKKKYKNR